VVDEAIEESRPIWRGRAACAATTLGAMAALLFLDGQLGPVSFALRRTTALTVLAAMTAFRMGWCGCWRLAGWAAVIAAMAIVVQVPSVPIALVGFAVALAAIEIGDGSRSCDGRLAVGLVPACFSYIALRFAVDLVPQIGAVTGAVARGADRYINRVQGLDNHLSITALGGTAVVLASLYLLWSWRRAGGIGRLVAAVAIPLAWFALLPVVTPEVSAGPIAAFSRGAYHGLFWLGVAGLIGTLQPTDGVGRFASNGEKPPSPALRAPSLRRGEGVGEAGNVSSTARRLPLAAACLAVALAGICLVGTALIGPVAGRSIRVYNRGGLDWERPVFGQFGAFTGGMFGLLPIYCRAEGYDFDVIDKPEKPASDKALTGPGNGSEIASVMFAITGWNPVLESLLDAGSDGATPAKSTTPAKAAAPSKEATIKGGQASPGRAASPPVVKLVPDTIEPADLERTQILVLINSPKIWDDRERRTILDFVSRGGSLLVLGDHTDVFGLMNGFNSLLGPLGIRFRFDSAYKARESWLGCQAAAPDAIAWSWDNENPGVAVGASLELSGSARPLLVGRYGFSDNGVRENVMGSFLGNYHYDKGERLGDVVLVATATYGRGRVVVWGDTSAFQGVSTYYPKVVGPMLAWLSRPAAWTERPFVRVAAALGLLASILWLWVVRATVKQVAMIAISLLVGLMVPWALSLPRLEAHVHAAEDLVLFDRSHFPASGHYNAKVNPIGPLYMNLLRSGFRVTEMEDWDPSAIARARGIAFVAPRRAFTVGEVNALLEAEERGAVVILTVGQPDAAGSKRLLDAHGLTLLPRPMGTVTPADPSASRREREKQPRFLDAWPIATPDGRDPAELPGVEVIYRHGEDVVALFRRVGRGGLLLIADTRFFSDMNVEDMSGYWLGNLGLIHDLFHRYLGADPDAVKPLFRSPEKPQ
jgi:uncharacterized protein DUF4350